MIPSLGLSLAKQKTEMLSSAADGRQDNSNFTVNTSGSKSAGSISETSIALIVGGFLILYFLKKKLK